VPTTDLMASKRISNPAVAKAGQCSGWGIHRRATSSKPHDRSCSSLKITVPDAINRYRNRSSSCTTRIRFRVCRYFIPTGRLAVEINPPFNCACIAATLPARRHSRIASFGIIIAYDVSVRLCTTASANES